MGGENVKKKKKNLNRAGALYQLTAMETNLGGNDSTHTKNSHIALAMQKLNVFLGYTLVFVSFNTHIFIHFSYPLKSDASALNLLSI